MDPYERGVGDPSENGSRVETEAAPICPGCGITTEESIFCAKCNAPQKIPVSKRSNSAALRASLHEALDNPVEKRPLVAGALLASLGAVLLAVGLFLQIEIGNKVLSSLLYAPGLLLLVRGVAAWRPLAINKLRSDHRAPIIYFRKFTTESGPGWLALLSQFFFAGLGRPLDAQKISTMEKLIAGAVKNAGPFIGLSDPAEEWPELGPATAWVNNDNWRRTVRLLLAASQAAIFHFVDAEVSPATLWEWNEALKYLPRQRIFALMTRQPETELSPLRLAQPERFWQAISAAAPGYQTTFPVDLHDCVLCFDEKQQPVIVPPGSSYWSGYDGNNAASALIQAFLRNGVLDRGPSVWRSRGGSMILGIGLAAVVIAVIFFLAIL